MNTLPFLCYFFYLCSLCLGNEEVELQITINCKTPNHAHFIAHDTVEFSTRLEGLNVAEAMALHSNHDLCVEITTAKEPPAKHKHCGILGSSKAFAGFEDKYAGKNGVSFDFELSGLTPGRYSYTMSLQELPSSRTFLSCSNTFSIVHFPGWDQYVQTFYNTTLTLANLKKEEDDTGGILPPGSPRYSVLSFEPLPDLLGPYPSPAKPNGKVEKNLVATFAGAKSKREIDSLVARFKRPNYKIILFVYDLSDWSEFNWLNEVIFVRIVKTMKWWFVKHFLHPDVVAAYDYVLIIDEDCNTSGLDPDAMLDDARMYGVQIGQPANGEGSYGSHEIVRVKSKTIVDAYGKTSRHSPVGTWTNFVECGPFVFFSADVWPCIYSILQPDLVCGYGYDLIWANCAPNRTGVLHKHTMIHENRKPGSGSNKNFGTRCGAEGIFAFQRLASLHMAPFDPHEIRDFEDQDKIRADVGAGGKPDNSNARLEKWLIGEIAQKKELLKNLQAAKKTPKES
jgi:hypothetical protein